MKRKRAMPSIALRLAAAVIRKPLRIRAARKSKLFGVTIKEEKPIGVAYAAKKASIIRNTTYSSLAM